MTRNRLGARAILLLPALVLVASLAACAPATTASTPAPSVSPSAVPNMPPQVAFGGKCASMLETKAVTAFLGAPVSLIPNTLLGPSDYSVPSLGGLECLWGDPRSTGEQFLDIFALPAALRTVSDKALTCGLNSGVDECYFNVVDSGYWFSGQLIAVKGVSSTPSPAAVKSVEALLAADAKTAGSPPAVKPIAGAWTRPSDCTALDSQTGIIAASGSSTLQANPLDTQSDSPDGYYAALTTSGYLGCSFSSDNNVPSGQLQGFTVELAPGGAWARHSLKAPAEANYTEASVSIPGTDAAYTFSDNQGIEYLEVFTGVNWVAFEPYGGPITVAQLTPVVSSILKGLG